MDQAIGWILSKKWFFIHSSGRQLLWIKVFRRLILKYFYHGQFMFKFCLQWLSWTGHWKDPSQEFIPYKIITVTNYKNFYTAQRKKLVNKAEILLLIEIITGTFQSYRTGTKSVPSFRIIHSLSRVLFCSFQGHLKTWRKILCQARPSFKLLTWTQQQHWILFLCIFVIFWCEPLVQFQSSVTPKSSSLPLTNTEREI